MCMFKYLWAHMCGDLCKYVLFVESTDQPQRLSLSRYTPVVKTGSLTENLEITD